MFSSPSQRKGGENNYYGDDLAKKIKEDISTSTSDNEIGNGALVLGEDLAEFILSCSGCFRRNRRRD